MNIKENCSSVSRAGDANHFPVLVTVCGTSSRFVHVTFVPEEIINIEGEKLKLSILTSFIPNRLFSFVRSRSCVGHPENVRLL